MWKGLIYVFCVSVNSIALFLSAFIGKTGMAFFHGMLVIFAGQLIINKFMEESNDGNRKTQ